MVKHLRPVRPTFLATSGIILLGLGLILREIVVVRTSSPATPGGWPILAIDLLLKLLGLGILGTLSAAVLSAIEQVRTSIKQAEADRRVENERWEALIQSLNSIAITGAAEISSPKGQLKRRHEAIDAVRKAAHDGNWDEARRLLVTLETQDLPDAEFESLSREIADLRGDAIARKLERIEASKGVNDSESVLFLFEEMVPLLEPTDRKPLEEDLARWFMALIQRKLRVGSIQPDVVALASRVTELFGSTVEGASLRAGLPTLRRAVGLCPRCGGPYVGADDACADCLERQRA